MANPQKQKGDRAELEAVTALVKQGHGLAMHPLQMRALGAGRKEDTGDIHVFPDVAIQVKNYAQNRLNAGLRSAAFGALRQSENGLVPFHLGMVVVPRARKDGFRWAATAVTWVLDSAPDAIASNPVEALDMVKADNSQLILVQRKGAEDFFVSSLGKWLDDYRFRLLQG